MGEFENYACGACVVCILIPTIVMISVSFQKLESNEVGLRMNKHFGYKAGEEVDKNGLHYVGLWHTFKVVSKTDQFKSYTITAFTENIIAVDLSVSIQYQVLPTYENLYRIIFDYDDIDSYFDARVMDALRRGIQSTDSDVLYSNRGVVTQTLKDIVSEAIEETGYSLNNLQITDIVVPPEMQAAIDDLVSAKLEVDVAFNERSKSLQEAENSKNAEIYYANIDANLRVQSAEADYNASIAILDAKLYSLRRQVENEENLIKAYQAQYPSANDKQIMELIKTHRYNTLVNTVGASGSNKVILDHKPTAIGALGDAIKQRLDDKAEL